MLLSWQSGTVPPRESVAVYCQEKGHGRKQYRGCRSPVFAGCLRSNGGSPELYSRTRRRSERAKRGIDRDCAPSLTPSAVCRLSTIGCSCFFSCYEERCRIFALRDLIHTTATRRSNGHRQTMLPPG